MFEARLPTALWVEAHLSALNAKGTGYYVANRGEHSSGIVMVRLSDMAGCSRLLIQQRNIDGVLGWMHALDRDPVSDAEADEAVRRAIERDPDLWVIEIEDKSMENPFEGTIF